MMSAIQFFDLFFIFFPLRYHIMRLTWAEKPKDRPEFHQLKLMIEDLLSKNSNYLDLALQEEQSLESQTTDTFTSSRE